MKEMLEEDDGWSCGGLGRMKSTSTGDDGAPVAGNGEEVVREMSLRAK